MISIDLEISEHRIAGRIFGLASAAARFGVSPSTLKRRWPLGWFPAPIRTTEKRIGWLEADILAWQLEKAKQRDSALAANRPKSSP